MNEEKIENFVTVKFLNCFIDESHHVRCHLKFQIPPNLAFSSMSVGHSQFASVNVTQPGNTSDNGSTCCRCEASKCQYPPPPNPVYGVVKKNLHIFCARHFHTIEFYDKSAHMISHALSSMSFSTFNSCWFSIGRVWACARAPARARWSRSRHCAYNGLNQTRSARKGCDIVASLCLCWTWNISSNW